MRRKKRKRRGTGLKGGTVMERLHTHSSPWKNSLEWEKVPDNHGIGLDRGGSAGRPWGASVDYGSTYLSGAL